jgi:hypothetical protein
MNHKMREIEMQLDRVKESCQQNKNGLQKVKEDVAKLTEVVETQSRKVEEAREAAATASNSGVFEELREREGKRNNVIMHGMGEAPSDHVGRARWDWDIQSCDNLFKALHLPVKTDAIRFVRRVGESGAHPRPLVVGFHEERDKARMLRADTRKSCFSNVDIVPDLTKAQRQEEEDLRKEMINRNKRASSEDRAKNLAWVVVGPRGAKRLVKKHIDPEEEMATGRRNRQRQETAAAPTQRQTTTPAVVATEVEMQDIEELDQTQEPPGAAMRGRLGSKRGRGGSADAEEPPPARAKH